MPGATLENITNLADKEVSALGKSDTAIVMGGADDVSKHIGLMQLGKFVNSRQNTNVMTVTAPHRHDLQETA
jgi:hypothetical protein